MIFLYSTSTNLACPKVSALDLIDGGISLVMRCPGYCPSAAIALENLTIDVFISPRELSEGGKKMSERVALLVQDFGAHIALPHLRHFQTRCLTENITALAAPGPLAFLSELSETVDRLFQTLGDLSYWMARLISQPRVLWEAVTSDVVVVPPVIWPRTSPSGN